MNWCYISKFECRVMEETRQNPEIFVAVTHSGEKFKAFALKRADGTNRLYLFVLPLGRSSL